MPNLRHEYELENPCIIHEMCCVACVGCLVCFVWALLPTCLNIGGRAGYYRIVEHLRLCTAGICRVRFLGMFLVLWFLLRASSLCEVFGRQILDMHLRFRIPSKSRTRVTWHSSIFLCGFFFSRCALALFF